MSFVRWVQERLVVHGYNIAVDGVYGPQTRTALNLFQQRGRNLPHTGVADPATVTALRSNPVTGKLDKEVEHVEETMPIWLEEATRRMGLHERTNNKSLAAWLRSGKFLGNPAKLPWCGDFVETCFARTLANEPLPNNPFWAQAWKDFGKSVKPIPGSVGVIRWNSKSGHVGFVLEATKDKIKLRGGNQSDMVKDQWFSRSKFIAFRWPNSVPITVYPDIKGGASSGSYGKTR